LADSAEQPRFIETLPRKGYRFIAPVTCIGENAPEIPRLDTVRPSSFRRRLGLLVTLAVGSGIAVGAGIGEARKWILNSNTLPTG
jgi:hypothetical protein